MCIFFKIVVFCILCSSTNDAVIILSYADFVIVCTVCRAGANAIEYPGGKVISLDRATQQQRDGHAKLLLSTPGIKVTNGAGGLKSFSYSAVS